MSAARAGADAAEAAGNPELTAARKWLLTFSVMVVAVMQVLDTSVTNVALPHMQGSRRKLWPKTAGSGRCSSTSHRPGRRR